LQHRPFPEKRAYAAYTVAELGEMLPTEIVLDSKLCHLRIFKWKQNALWQVGYFDPKDIFMVHSYCEETEADSRAKMLIFLKTNNLI